MVMLAILALLLYITHLVSLVAAWVAVGVLALWLTLHDISGRMRQGHRDLSSLWSACRSRIFMTLCAFLPTFMLVGSFLVEQGMTQSAPTPAARLWDRLRRLEVLISLSLSVVQKSISQKRPSGSSLSSCFISSSRRESAAK
jgi:hypothetical protein